MSASQEFFSKEKTLPRLIEWFNNLPAEQRTVAPSEMFIIRVKAIENEHGEPTFLIQQTPSDIPDGYNYMGESVFLWIGETGEDLVATDTSFFEVSKHVQTTVNVRPMFGHLTLPKPDEGSSCEFNPSFGEDFDQSVKFGINNAKLSTIISGFSVDVILAKGSEYTEQLGIDEVGSFATTEPSILGEDIIAFLMNNGEDYVFQIMASVDGNYTNRESTLTIGGVNLETMYATGLLFAEASISEEQRNSLMESDTLCVEISPPIAPPFPLIEVVEGPNSSERNLSFIVRNIGTATAKDVVTTFFEHTPSSWIGRYLVLAEPETVPKGEFTRRFATYVGENTQWAIGDLEPGEELSLDFEFAPTFFSEGTTCAVTASSSNAGSDQYVRDVTPAKPSILEVHGPGTFSVVSLAVASGSSFRVKFGEEEETTVTEFESPTRTLEEDESVVVEIYLDTNRSAKAIRDKASSSNRTITVDILDWGEAGDSANIFEDSATIVGIPETIPHYWMRLGYSCQFRSPTADMISAIESYDTSRIYRMNSAFSGVTSEMYRNIDLSGWNTSRVTNMEGMFFDAAAFNGNISNWDTSNVTNMRRMFRETNEFNGDISEWDTSKVEIMTDMFYSAKEFNQDITGWDVSSVKGADYGFNNMFNGTEKFDQDLTPWVNNPAITNISGLLRDAKAFNSPVAEWDISKFSDMSNMFRGCSSFNQDVSGWDVSHVTNMSYMFYGCTAFNRDISGWDTGNVTNMSYMFGGGTAFNQDISGWNVGNCLTFNSMFSNSAFNQSLNGWEFNDNASLDSMFSQATTFNADISEWDVSKIVNFRSMFISASSFNQDISMWDTSSATSMSFMFSGCTEFNQDISTWDTSNVTNMSYMFYQAPSFNQDLDAWDTSNVTNMGNMFYQAVAFNGSIGGWDTSNVTSASSMFRGATLFNQDISGWDVSKITSSGMRDMFNTASTFNQDLSGWCVANIATKPNGFDTSTPAWVKEDRQPVWGTCP